MPFGLSAAAERAVLASAMDDCLDKVDNLENIVDLRGYLCRHVDTRAIAPLVGVSVQVGSL